MSWDKRWMRHAFAAAAPRYDRMAALQRQIGERLLSRLPPWIEGIAVDVGAGTGWCAVRLRERYHGAEPILVDIAEAMLHQARIHLGGNARYLAADAECLPLADGCAALVVSNLALQWCHDPCRALGEMGRILRPGGRLLVSTFAPGTLEELRQAWRRVDQYTHVNEFTEPEMLAAGLREAGFRQWRMRRETLVCRYPSLGALLQALKGIGAHNVTQNRPRHLLGKRRLQALESAYPRAEDGVAASFVPLYLTAVR